MKHNLNKQERSLLVGWAAEGLTLSEINERAAKEDPPFKVAYTQLKWIRQRCDKTFSAIRDEFERDALTEGLARRAVRIRQLEELWDLHMALIKARGQAMAREDIPGGSTGLMVRDYKGKDADTPVYKYDAALIREMRGLFDDIARELGDRRTNVDLSGGGELVLKVQYGDDGNKRTDDQTAEAARPTESLSE